MIRYTFFTLVTLTLGCSQNPQSTLQKKTDSVGDTISIQRRDTLTNITLPERKMLIHKTDSLTSKESKILFLIANENEFIFLGKNVERFYENGSGKLILSKLMFNKKELDKAGYVDFELIIQGEISDQIIINYSYNMGQASQGFGYVVGNDSHNYLHTIRSCGISSCVTQVFDTGKKIFEKENPN